MRFPVLLSCFLAASTALCAAPDYTAKPLHPRAGPPAGGKPFTLLAPADTGVTVPNVFEDPRMWGNRFR